jgi:hypothetical protein
MARTRAQDEQNEEQWSASTADPGQDDVIHLTPDLSRGAARAALWPRRGGRPPFRGQSYALAAPRLSSGVRWIS